MKKPNIKFDRTTAMGLVGGLLVLGGQIMKSVSDKKTSDAKLIETVNKVLDERSNK